MPIYADRPIISISMDISCIHNFNVICTYRHIDIPLL